MGVSLGCGTDRTHGLPIQYLQKIIPAAVFTIVAGMCHIAGWVLKKMHCVLKYVIISQPVMIGWGLPSNLTTKQPGISEIGKRCIYDLNKKEKYAIIS